MHSRGKCQFDASFSSSITNIGVRGGAVGCSTLLQAGRSPVRFPVASLEFFIDIILPAALWPSSPLSL